MPGASAEAVRSAATYVIKLCILERQTFFAYFPHTGKNSSLEQLLCHLGGIFYDVLRPRVVACDDLDMLREL